MSAKSFTKISSNPKRIKQHSKRFTPGVLMEDHQGSSVRKTVLPTHIQRHVIPFRMLLVSNAGGGQRDWARSAGPLKRKSWF